MLVLLITFLLSASTFESDSLEIALPQVRELREVEKDAIVVEVDQEGRLVLPDGLADSSQAQESLERLLLENTERPTLAFAVHRNCLYVKFYPLLSAAARAGWTRIILLTEEIPSDTGG